MSTDGDGIRTTLSEGDARLSAPHDPCGSSTLVGGRTAYPEAVHTDETWEDEPPRRAAPYVDGAWGRTANPNTADGELQNIAAFAHGFTRLTGPRRAAARLVVWLILLGTVTTIVVGVVHYL
jgi:hypothetical protein